MSIEIKQPELNSTEVFTNGVETPSVVENIPLENIVESNTNNLSQINPQEENLKQSLGGADLENRIQYDSKEVKSSVLGNLSTKEADSWSSLIESKKQGEAPTVS